ncbi:MAG: porin family protein [Nitratireductor sp.]|nr:porin family protein [Nitratireductor sp.]
MRTVRGLTGISLVAILLASPAMAADIIETQPVTDPLPPSQTNLLWSGPYVGIYGGYNWLASRIGGNPDVDGIDGLTGGGYAGYNVQFDQNWVAGIEGMAGVSGAENTFGNVNVEQNWEASLRGRMGYAFENSMVYGLAGLAGTKATVTTPTGSDSAINLGWTIGAGLETHLTENVTARVEYDYSDYGSRNYSLGGGNGDVSLDSHSLKLGVGLKF